MDKLRYILNIAIIALLLLTVAVQRNEKVLGTPVDQLFKPAIEDTLSPITELENGSIRINSARIVKDVSGYGGPTPVHIFIEDGKITKVEALPNSETPDFQDYVIESGLLSSWDGLTPEKAIEHKVDAVSGATLSSESFKTNVNQALQFYTQASPTSTSNPFTLKNIIGLFVIITGIVVSYVAKKGKWRNIQLALNVIVLGFWCGYFLSLSLLVNWLSNGANLAVAMVPLTLLVVAIVLPLVGKKGHYCAWHCPLGSIQELAGKTRKQKLKIPVRWLKYLNYMREGLLLGLLFIMWLGVGFSIMDYELFAAFIFQSASTGILIAALAFVVLSIFLTRPYCRFVCPTGTLLQFSTTTKSN